MIGAVIPFTDQRRIAEALSWVPADDRETWVRMAMAVKSELGEDGFDVWNRWSRGADSYCERDARAVWRSVDIVSVIRDLASAAALNRSPDQGLRRAR